MISYLRRLNLHMIILTAGDVIVHLYIILNRLGILELLNTKIRFLRLIRLLVGILIMLGTKRFNNWLENMVDWGISRNRYWGCPMPIWICSSCGEKHVIGSIKELDDMKVGDIDVKNMELHRPYIDEVHIKCPKCNGIMNRVTDVMDVWFDSGAMPYAQCHYPFENKELFESQFPADFIAEGVDQTRGWFNSLICISTIVSGVSSFKNVVVK